jgi:hypothetical protein
VGKVYDMSEVEPVAPAAAPVVETTKDKVARIMGRPPTSFAGGLDASARGALQVGSMGAADEVISGGRSLVRKVAGDDRPLVDIYREERKEYQDADEMAKRQEPQSWGQGAAGASLLPWNLAAKIVSPIGRLLAGAGMGMFGGLAGSKADLTRGEYKKAIADTAAGGLLGTIAAVPAGAGTAARTGKAEREYGKQITHDLTDGANPTQARRATGDDGAAETIVSWVEKNKDARKAIENTDRRALIDIAQKDVSALAAKTAPVYPQIDAAAGKVHFNDINKALVDHIDELKLSQKQNEPLIAAFEDLRTKLADKMQAQGYEYTHKQLREWVTGLLEQKQQVKGTLAETPIAVYKDELHDVADDFLRRRLDDVAAKHPQLAPDIAQLRRDNRDLSAAIRVRDVAENADKLSNWKGKTLAEKVGSVVSRGVTGAIGGGVIGGFSGSVGMGAAGGALAGLTAGVAAQGLTKMAVNRLGQLSRAVKAGNATAAMVQDALDAGVPEHVLRALSVSGPGIGQRVWDALSPRQKPAEAQPQVAGAR